MLALIAVYVPLAGGGPVDPAGRGDGRAGRAGDAGRAPRLAPLRAGAGARSSPWRSTAASPPTSAGSSASPPCSASSCWPRRCGGRSRRRLGAGGWRRALAEGAAVTVAATLATAPLIAFHFETLSTTTLVANLLAMPAVAPAMWLGMSPPPAGQVPGLAARGAERAQRPAARLHRPGRRLVRPAELGRAHVRARAGRPASPPTWRSPAAGGRRPCARPPAPLAGCAAAPPAGRNACRRVGRSASPAAWPLAARRCWLLVLAPLAPAERGAGAAGRAAGRGARRRPGRRDPAAARAARRPCWSTAGRPATVSPRSCDAAGVERLGAAVVTHDQSDHAGGIEELLGALPDRPARLRAARPSPARRGRGGRRRARRGRRRATSCARAACGSRSSGRRASCSRRRSPAPTRTSWRWSCSPAGATSRCC